MAVHTNFGLSSTLSYWFTRDASSISTATTSTVDLVNSDGTHTVLTSAGNDFTFTNSGGVITLTGGTITSMSRTDGASTTYENVTGISYAATTFQSHLADADLQGIANNIFSGADTFTGSSLNDFFRAYGGNDTVNGGAGFDTVSYFSSFMTGPVAITVGTTNTVGAATVATGTATAASNTIGTDTLNGVEEFIGTNGNDTFTAFTNFFSNNSSFNQFEGLGGNDTIVGNGNTRIAFNNNSFSSGPAGATLTWTNSAGNTNGSGTSTGTGVGTDTFSGVNAVEGSQFNDVFTATGASNASYGVQDGGFNFIGLGGNDTLTGGGTNVRWDYNFSRYDFESSGITATIGTTNTVGAPTTDVGSVTGASAGTDTLHFIEAIRGTNFVDTYTAFADFRGLFGSYNEFEGMAGNDTITGNGATRVAFGNATAGVTVTWTPTAGNSFIGAGTASGDSSVGTDTFTGVNSARGSQFADTFTATGAHGIFSFDGRGGNDVFNGGTFNFAAVDFDTAMYNRATAGITVMMDSTSTVTGDSSVGTDTLNQIEEVRGSHFNDTYTATAAFSASFGRLNVFSPGGGDDSITGNGATQIDYHSAGSAMAAVTVNLNTGIAQSTAAGDLAQIGTDTFTGVNGVRGSQFNDTFIGSDGVQAEIFRGEEGNDQIDGGGGSHNTASYTDSISGVVVNLTTGTASDGWGGTDTLVRIQDVSGSEFVDTITGDSGSNILIGKSGDDTLFGGGGNDILIGDDNGVNQVTNNAFGTFGEFAVGNDTLDGGSGADQMTGGKGDDTYFVDNVGDVVTENAGEGNDLVHASIDYTLGANVESLILDGTTVNGAGNSADNAIIGNASDNIIDGKAGADFMQGGAGNDIYFVDSAGDAIVENPGEGNDIVHASIDYTIGANIESLILDGTTINGAGNATDNAIIGNASDNIIDGRAGADFMQGGAGNDIYFVDNAGDAIVENPNEGNDIVHASIDYTIGANIESLILDGTTINGAGNGTDNAIIGNASDNIIDGRAGADFMQGGAGNDIYFVDNAGDAIVENPNEGNDIVHATIDYTIGANIESLILDGTANLAGAGNSTNNALVGNSGDNNLDGRGGQDFLIGNGGNDTFEFKSGEAAGDVIADFVGNGASPGDSLLFIGFGTAAQGATFTEIGATNQWQIHSGLDAHNEVITLQNSASVHASDYLFV